MQFLAVICNKYINIKAVTKNELRKATKLIR